MEFHERLRYLIDCEEMKIKDLAAKLHLAPSTLGNYVQGTREPDYDTLRRIADYFGVSIDYLLGHETPAVDDERRVFPFDQKTAHIAFFHAHQMILNVFDFHIYSSKEPRSFFHR